MCTIHRGWLQQPDMVSPIEGTVSDINPALAADLTKLALRDPYGEGWLMTVQAPDAKTSFRNLLGGPLVRWWNRRVRKPPATPHAEVFGRCAWRRMVE